MVKILPVKQRLGLDPWVGKIPWRRELQPTLVFLPEEFHRQRSLVGYSPWGHKESDLTEQLTHTQSKHYIFYLLYTINSTTRRWSKIICHLHLLYRGGPQYFWHQWLISWKTIFPQTWGLEVERWFWDDSNALHLLYTLFLLLLHQLHLRWSGIRSQRFGTTAL